MTREELVEKMLEICLPNVGPFTGKERERMAAALDVAVGELLKDAEPDCVYSSSLIIARRSRYLPKSDPAVEAVKSYLSSDQWRDRFSMRHFEEIVAAVRKADKEASNGTL